VLVHYEQTVCRNAPSGNEPGGGGGGSGVTSNPAGAPCLSGAALALDEFCGAVAAALSKSCAARIADSASRLAEVGLGLGK